MRVKVGHYLDAGSVDHAALKKIWLRHGSGVGVEVAMGLVEGQLASQWSSRRTPMARAMIRGLCYALRRISVGAFRRPVFPVTRGRG